MKNPCINCKNEYFRCRRICPTGIRYQIAKAKERELVKAKKRKEIEFDSYKVERILDTKHKAGLE